MLEKLFTVSTFGTYPGSSPGMLRVRLGSQRPLQEGGQVAVMGELSTSGHFLLPKTTKLG